VDKVMDMINNKEVEEVKDKFKDKFKVKDKVQDKDKDKVILIKFYIQYNNK
jgi:hypothetical protein